DTGKYSVQQPFNSSLSLARAFARAVSIRWSKSGGRSGSGRFSGRVRVIAPLCTIPLSPGGRAASGKGFPLVALQELGGHSKQYHPSDVSAIRARNCFRSLSPRQSTVGTFAGSQAASGTLTASRGFGLNSAYHSEKRRTY